MAEFHANLWAPWRMDYIRSLGEDAPGGCFLCGHAVDPAADESNNVVHRSGGLFVVMNRFPYSNGHLLVAPVGHKAALGDLTAEEAAASLRLLARCMEALGACVHAQGFNVGMNVGRCAGAGLPDHLHWHVVPRWGGDTNFMSVIGDARVIPESMQANAAALRRWFVDHPDRSP